MGKESRPTKGYQVDRLTDFGMIPVRDFNRLIISGQLYSTRMKI